MVVGGDVEIQVQACLGTNHTSKPATYRPRLQSKQEYPIPVKNRRETGDTA